MSLRMGCAKCKTNELFYILHITSVRGCLYTLYINIIGDQVVLCISYLNLLIIIGEEGVCGKRSVIFDCKKMTITLQYI